MKKCPFRPHGKSNTYLINFIIPIWDLLTDMTKQVVTVFIASHFGTPGSDQISWIPTDFPSMPPFSKHIRNTTLREWIKTVHNVWKELGRRSNAT